MRAAVMSRIPLTKPAHRIAGTARELLVTITDADALIGGFPVGAESRPCARRASVENATGSLDVVEYGAREAVLNGAAMIGDGDATKRDSDATSGPRLDGW